MKKSMLILMAISLVFAMAAPVMAETAVEFSGRYYVRGTYMDNGGYFSDDDGPVGSGQTLEDHAMSFYETELRMNVTFRVNENVDVFMRMDIGDYNWGTTNPRAHVGATVDDFQLDRLWTSIKTPYGILDVGRMAGGQWGLEFGNWATNGSDRIKFTTAIGDLALGAIIEKNLEADSNLAVNAIDDDADIDTYYLFGVYKQETFETGLLLAYTRDRANTGANNALFIPLNNGGGQNVKVSERDQYLANVYGIFNFGPFTLQGEVGHFWGDIDWEANNLSDTDIDSWLWNIEGQYAAGPFSMALGFAWVEGIDESDASKLITGAGGGDLSAANFTNGGIGSDFCPLVIMTDYDGAVNNYIAWNQQEAFSGMELLYLNASYAATETLTFGFAWGIGWAEEEWSGNRAGTWATDDDYGWEADLTLSWDAMDNVNYSVALGYMDTGDLYAATHNGSALGQPIPDGAIGSDGEDVWAMRHTLTINF